MTYAIQPSGAGGSGATVDRFAPRYLVGIAGAGFPAAPQGAPWVYVQDTGDGQGLLAAYTMAAIDAGEVHISPGVIDLATGPVLGPVAIPGNVAVYGSGRGVTTIKGPTVGNQSVFALAAGSSLQDLTITAGALDVAAVAGIAAVELIGTARLNRVDITTSRPAGGTLLACVRINYAGAAVGFSQVENVKLTNLTPAPEPPAIESCGIVNDTPDDSAVLTLSSVVIVGGNWGVRANRGSTIGALVVCTDQQFGAFRSVSTSGSFQLVGFGALVGPTSSNKWVGVEIQGGPSWVERGALVGDGSVLRYTGVRLGGPAGSFAAAVQACLAIGMGVAFQAGTFAGDGAQGSSFVDCFASESSIFAMWLGPTTQQVNVRGFKATVVDGGGGGPPPVTLAVDGVNHAIAACQLQNPSARGSALVTAGSGHSFSGVLLECAGDAAGWEHAAVRSALAACVLNMTTGSSFPALRITGDDTTASGNSCNAGVNSGVSAIDCSSGGNALTGNRTTTDLGIAGVSLLAPSSNTAVTGTVARNAGVGNAAVDANAGGTGSVLTANLGF